MTAPELARAMEVSTRTVLRDIDQLSAAGVPLWGERGRLGGFRLREGWSTQLTGMTEPEASALLLAGLPGPATELGLGAAAASARLKLVASLPGEWREQADRVGQRLHIDPVDWYRTQDSPRFLREVADAVWRARRIEVRYESWRGETRRVLEPLGLVLKAGAWYLVARATDRLPRPESVRTYRLASLLELQVGAAFRRPKHVDLGAIWQASAARFEAELRSVEVRARVTPRCLKWLANARISFASHVDDEVTLRVESVAQGARQLLGFGGEIEVLSPPALRERMAQQAAAVLARHL
ncbi:helix-turn-helix transcriptional regulator [Hydrogenophaga laconesensis]|uniref:DNA-binding transcriptional regulator YafY n=1 Tax=Hydrogenophaga laconesensis TaxID=1805971 RepID=A0ABU1VF15_9BURK|nr:WYL domain-containing protein [Hydrogenophaga laconesensis]MDR7095788.1 putative DNA-binding transcriptional regulator YafY [Hydrogenophaga laconesensis]